VTRAPALLLAALAAGAAGCATGDTNSAVTRIPLCSAGDGGAGNEVVLMAQSVPTASWVPCIRTALPLGWGFQHLEARDGDATFWLNSDRDGQKAIGVHLRPSCDVAGATEIASDRPGMRRLERVRRVSPSFTGERYYVFPGGCLTVAFQLSGDSPGEALALASQVVGALPRQVLQAQVRRESGDRLDLDPPREGTGEP
jgi:hypothetical protein